jgi:hypothetical protein
VGCPLSAWFAASSGVSDANCDAAVRTRQLGVAHVLPSGSWCSSSSLYKVRRTERARPPCHAAELRLQWLRRYSTSDGDTCAVRDGCWHRAVPGVACFLGMMLLRRWQCVQGRCRPRSAAPRFTLLANDLLRRDHRRRTSPMIGAQRSCRAGMPQPCAGLGGCCNTDGAGRRCEAWICTLRWMSPMLSDTRRLPDCDIDISSEPAGRSLWPVLPG